MIQALLESPTGKTVDYSFLTKVSHRRICASLPRLALRVRSPTASAWKAMTGGASSPEGKAHSRCPPVSVRPPMRRLSTPKPNRRPPKPNPKLDPGSSFRTTRNGTRRSSCFRRADAVARPHGQTARVRQRRRRALRGTRDHLGSLPPGAERQGWQARPGGGERLSRPM
jgi:hypothetical protein